MTNYVYIAQSLDGYIAGKNGETDWLEAIENPEKSDFGFADFMQNIDAIVMGRNTFEKVLSFGEWIYDKPVFVASSSLTNLPKGLKEGVFLLKGTPSQMVKTLRDRGYENLYIDGGKLICSCLAEGLIDTMIITTVPILLGDGFPLFGLLPKKIKLKMINCEILSDQLIKTTYDVEKGLKWRVF